MDWQAWREKQAAALPSAGNIGVIHDVPARLAELTIRIAQCRLCAEVDHAGWTASEYGHGLGVMFVGESPGTQERAANRCFVGPAGQALKLLLAETGLNHELLYLTNTVRCFAPDKSNLNHILAGRCQYHLHGEILTLLPAKIVLLGRFAWEAIHGPHTGALALLRQTWTPIPPAVAPSGFTFPTAFMYHPAAGLRDPSYMGWLRDDLVWLHGEL